MKLKWLEIERFRTVKPGTRLVFDDGINVLLGKNGTGKTTLLELISALVRGDVSPYSEDELDLSFGLQTEIVACDVHLQNEQDAETGAFMSSLDLRLLTANGPVRLGLDPYSAFVEAGGGKWQARLFNPMGPSMFAKSVSAIKLALRQNRSGRPLEDLSLPISRRSRRFDEGLDMYGEFFGDHAEVDWALAYTPSGIQSDSTERSLVFSGSVDAEWSDGSVILRAGKPDSWLTHLAHLLDVDSLTVYLRRTHVSPDDGGKLIDYRQADVELSYRDGRLITERQLSYGQKRILAFHFYLHMVKGPIIADEIVNGMHHAWVEACMEMIREEGQQAFLTSQNPLLLDELEFEDADAVRRTFIIAEVEGGQFRWRQLDEGEARRFFTAYETGIQHVGEVLLTEGLW